MSRDIDADKLKLEIRKDIHKNNDETDISRIWDVIDNQPAADVEPVKHGHWEEVEYNVDWTKKPLKKFVCSKCKEKAFTDGFEWFLSDYCPHCGAKMDEEAEK